MAYEPLLLGGEGWSSFVDIQSLMHQHFQAHPVLLSLKVTLQLEIIAKFVPKHVLCKRQEIVQDNRSQAKFPCDSLNHKRIHIMEFGGF